MKANRPLTAPKDNRLYLIDTKTVIPGYKRPVSAKTHSLRQVIQVIENTLSKGAQTILTKSKTLDKFSKFKMQMERAKKQKERFTLDKDIPQYKTQFIIGNSADIQSCSMSIKSAKNINSPQQFSGFTPYNKTSAKPEEILLQKRNLKSKCGTVQWSKDRKKTEKEKKQHIIHTQDENRQSAIEGWQNQPSILQISYLLNDGRA